MRDPGIHVPLYDKAIIKLDVLLLHQCSMFLLLAANSLFFPFHFQPSLLDANTTYCHP
jgi:hypothetical protein